MTDSAPEGIETKRYTERVITSHGRKVAGVVDADGVVELKMELGQYTDIRPDGQHVTLPHDVARALFFALLPSFRADMARAERASLAQNQLAALGGQTQSALRGPW